MKFDRALISFLDGIQFLKGPGYVKLQGLYITVLEVKNMKLNTLRERASQIVLYIDGD